MKKITFLLIALLVAMISYSQLIYVEGFGGNVLPTGWTIHNAGTGAQQWTFGSGVMPGSVADFTSSAAIFNDDAAGDTGNNDNVILWTGSDTGTGFDLSIYPDGVVTLSYEYALNITNGADGETLSVVIWDNTNTAWITLVEYNTDMNPTLDSVDITAAINANSGINPSAIFIGFEYNDTNSVWGWGAGIDTVKLRVVPKNDNCWTATNVTNNLPYQAVTRTSGNTNGISNNGYVTPAGCSAGMNNGLWYTFTSQITGEFNITSLTPDFDHEIGVYLVGDCFNPASFVCVDNVDSSGSGSSETLSFNVIEGVQYFINIGYFSFNTYLQTSGDLEVSMFYSVPANNDCANPTNLIVGTNFNDQSITTTNVGATASGETPIPSCGIFAGGEDVWYNVTVPSSGNLTIETGEVIGSTLNNTVMSVYSGTCGNLTEIACNDAGSTGLFSLISLTGQNPGDVLLIRVFEWNNNTFDEFQISVYDDSTASTQENNITGLALYPNPITDLLTIEAQEEITKLSIYNQIGQLVKTITPNQTKVSVNLENLATGIYIVKIEANDKVSSKRIIKK